MAHLLFSFSLVFPLLLSEVLVRIKAVKTMDNFTDFSINHTTIDEISTSLSLDRSLFLTVASLVTGLSIGGNFYILICILTHEALQRPRYLFVASLAITDLILALTVMVPRLSHEILGRWIFGHFFCQVYHAMDVTLCTSSILHLGCISIDRYMAVVHRPLLYEERVTNGRVFWAILGCWSLAGFTGFFPVFTGIYSNTEHLKNSMENSALTCDLVVNKYFSVIAGIISFWIPGKKKGHSHLCVLRRRW